MLHSRGPTSRPGAVPALFGMRHAAWGQSVGRRATCPFSPLGVAVAHEDEVQLVRELGHQRLADDVHLAAQQHVQLLHPGAELAAGVKGYAWDAWK